MTDPDFRKLIRNLVIMVVVKIAIWQLIQAAARRALSIQNVQAPLPYCCPWTHEILRGQWSHPIETRGEFIDQSFCCADGYVMLPCPHADRIKDREPISRRR